jgi:hypothetical protein
MSAIRFRATVGDDGAIRPPEGVSLPGGEVEVTVRPAKSKKKRLSGYEEMAATRRWMLELAARAERELAGLDLPPDLAKNHDHYAHGKPLE